LASIPGYREAFAKAYPDQSRPVSLLNIGRAIADFERGLSTPSRWDRYLEGEVDALTQGEQKGARLFANIGCLGCHMGPYLGGTTYEKVGRVVPWPNQTDHGRMEVTRDPADDMKFKVPGLRNVAATAPYFHDGSVQTLEGAVHKMGVHQLGIYLTDDDVKSIVTWLGSLTGDLPQQYIVPPTLPLAQRP
jgi:cytochrome c peroxidase